MQLTKEERHEVYKKLLEYMKADYEPYSICCYIKDATQLVVGIGLGVSFLPELLAQRPDNVLVYEFWWHRNQLQPRLDALQKCIELTAPDKN